MRFIDLSHPIRENMPLYPGTPPVRIEQLRRIETDGYREKRITFTTHTGTHVDAPAHILENGKTLDQLPLSLFYGKGIVLDVRAFKGQSIPAEFLQTQNSWQSAEYVLFFTGFSARWGSEAYFKDFPVLSLAAADLLINEGKLKGVGFDAVSPDTMDSDDLPVHHKFLNAEKLIIENLTDLSLLLNKEFELSLFPIPVSDADGLPVRAVALLRD